MTIFVGYELIVPKNEYNIGDQHAILETVGHMFTNHQLRNSK